MAPTSDADLSVDYYDLLAIPATASESEIRRAYRKTSLLYHPDKVKPTPENLEKFQLLQTAIGVLTDAAEKSKYDQTREAKQRRLAEKAAMDSRRREMVEDLEKREAIARGTHTMGGVKRTLSDRELAIQRIGDENRKKRQELMEKRKQEAQARTRAQHQPSDPIDRSVKIRWIKEGDGFDLDEQALEENFPAGHVENVVILKDKKRRIEGRDNKVMLGTAVIVFSSLSIAKQVVAQGPWDGIESVEWTKEKTPEGT